LDEISAGISQQIQKRLLENLLSIDNIFSYCGDCASVNFTKHSLVFEKLKLNLQNQYANCLAHILHNCTKQACGRLQIDIESVAVKIFNHFSSFSKHTEELKAIFYFCGDDYKNLLCHVGTRWLTLCPAVRRVAKCWAAITSDFLSLGGDDCPCQIWKYLEVCETCEAAGKEMYVIPACCTFLRNVLLPFQCLLKELEMGQYYNSRATSPDGKI
jgi:hypothetical protein